MNVAGLEAHLNTICTVLFEIRAKLGEDAPSMERTGDALDAVWAIKDALLPRSADCISAMSTVPEWRWAELRWREQTLETGFQTAKPRGPSSTGST